MYPNRLRVNQFIPNFSVVNQLILDFNGLT